MGIDVVYFSYDGIDRGNDCINGRAINRQGTWYRVQTRIPDIVDISPFCWPRETNGYSKRRGELLDYLAARSYLTDLPAGDYSVPGSKDVLPQRLALCKEFESLALEDIPLQTPEDLVRGVEEWGSVVVKAVSSQLGKSVHRITLDAQTHSYTVGFKTEETVYDKAGLIGYAQEHFFDRRYILQRYFSSRSRGGDPIDCRIHVEKNGHNEWEPARIYVRVGTGQKVISNVNQGGGEADLEQWLKANHADDWQDIKTRIYTLASTLPYYLEAINGRALMTLGLDVGIGDKGECCLFEINRQPMYVSHVAETSLLRVPYYHWLYQHVVQGGGDSLPAQSRAYLAQVPGIPQVQRPW